MPLHVLRIKKSGIGKYQIVFKYFVFKSEIFSRFWWCPLCYIFLVLGVVLCFCVVCAQWIVNYCLPHKLSLKYM